MAKTETITQDLKEAMLKKDSLRVSVLRMLIAGLTNARIAKVAVLTEEEEVAVLRRELKKREEAISLYIQGKRPELAEKEKQEIEIIKPYLPQMMDEAGVKQVVNELKKAGEWPADFGQAMRLVMAKIKGQAEGKVVAEVVKQSL